jgi:hypothetical protein
LFHILACTRLSIPREILAKITSHSYTEPYFIPGLLTPKKTTTPASNMRLNLLVGLSPVALTFASAVPVYQGRSTTSGAWQVTGFETGCSPGGCTYTFVITGHASQNTPSFNTTCQGTDVAGDYQACHDKTINANLLPRGSPIWGVQVRHRWSTDSYGGFSEAYGNANVTEGTSSFTVPITQVDGAS